MASKLPAGSGTWNVNERHYGFLLPPAWQLQRIRLHATNAVPTLLDPRSSTIFTPDDSLPSSQVPQLSIANPSPSSPLQSFTPTDVQQESYYGR